MLSLKQFFIRRLFFLFSSHLKYDFNGLFGFDNFKIFSTAFFYWLLRPRNWFIKFLLFLYFSFALHLNSTISQFPLLLSDINLLDNLFLHFLLFFLKCVHSQVLVNLFLLTVLALLQIFNDFFIMFRLFLQL